VVFETRFMAQREADGRICGIIGLAIDISDRLAMMREREKIERKLLDVQKLESLGVLAGGVAHDFNNLLTAIMGNANLARLTIPPASPAAANLNQIEQASQLAAGLCQQLLAYAGRGRLDPRRGILMNEKWNVDAMGRNDSRSKRSWDKPELTRIEAGQAELGTRAAVSDGGFTTS
jgi:signal transduction histidine kinase